jgi:signal transduction histidine kinase
VIGRRLGVRQRITLLVAGSMVLAGAAGLALTHFAVASVLADPAPVSAGPLPSATPSPGTASGDVFGPSAPGEGPELKQRVAAEVQRLRAELRDRTLIPLWQRGGVLLLALGAVGLAIGWVLSGYAVRPMRDIAGAARRIASRDVRGRVNWTGPRDEARELADTVDDLLARLEEAVDDQWRFVANASHELKTPLAINRTLLEVAMGRPGVPPEVTQLGETLLEVNARHERMIDGLLTLARSEHTVARPVPVELSEVVRHVVEIARPEAQRAGVRVEADVGDTPMDGDPALLERLALNLVQNGIRYNVPDGWVEVTSVRQGPAVRLRVSNSGPEVSSSDVPGLFEPFRRLHDRVGSSRGTGLGLSIVRSVARAHGGDVVATPRPGGGLDVEVTLRPEGGAPEHRK